MIKSPSSATTASMAQASLTLVAKAACSIVEAAADRSEGSRSSPIACATVMSPAIRRWLMASAWPAVRP